MNIQAVVMVVAAVAATAAHLIWHKSSTKTMATFSFFLIPFVAQQKFNSELMA